VPSTLKMFFSKDGQNPKFCLDFSLLAHPFVEKWLRCLQEELAKGTPIKNGGVYYGSGIHSAEGLKEKLLQRIEVVSRFAPNEIHLDPAREINQELLNNLHKEFERLSEWPQFSPGGQWPEGMEALIDINEIIHQYETILVGKMSPYFGLDVNFLVNYKIDLTPDDLKLFSTEVEYGQIRLNYATVGVPVLSAFELNEHRPPVPQSQFRPDFHVSFNPPRKFEKWAALSEWLKRFERDISDPTLALGYIPLAKLDRSSGLSEQEIFLRIKENPVITKIEIQ
jgi:hypothetical protein